MKLRRAYSKSLLCLGALMLVLAMSACSRPKVASQCSSDAQCGAGESCSAGVCVVHVDPVVACTRTDDCAPTQVCADNVCVDDSQLDGRCEVGPQDLFFDVTPIGMASTARLTIANHSSASLLVSIGEIHQVKSPSGGASSAFRFGDGDKAGDFVVPAGASDENPGLLELSVDFNPDAVGDFVATLQVWRPSSCAREVTLKGTGVVATCVVKPTVVRTDGTVRPVANFGYVNPGAKAVRRITFAEVRTQRTTFTLHGIEQPEQATSAPFAVEGGQTTITVPGGGEPVGIEVSFAPTDLGVQSGKLEVLSDDPYCPAVAIELRGIGGGPKIDAQPEQLEFGQVELDAYQYRRVVVKNVGTNLPYFDDDNLEFVVPVDGGGMVPKPAEIAGTDATGFSVAWPPEGYPLFGLEEGQTADVRVKFAPRSLGRREAVLRIYSNDPERPTLDVPLTGLGASMGGMQCEYEVRPPALDFGILEPSRYLTLTFEIVNRGTAANICVLSMLDVNRATREAGAFVLIDGAVGVGAPVSIPAGSRLLVPVRFGPSWRDGTCSGEIEFYVNSTLHSEAKVSLSGVSSPSCLMIGPRESDFGSIGVNCNSRERTFAIHNVCSSNVVISNMSVGAGTSSEFSITQHPPLPVTVGAGVAAIEFGVTYHPVDEGDDFGTVTLTLAGSSTPLVIPLEGRGAIDPVQTDVFAVPLQQKVDVLLIVDDSMSMSNKQAKFTDFFTNLMSAAITGNVDYHLAVTTTGADDPADTSGRFLPLTGSNPRVIWPSTPNGQQVFMQTVYVGTSGGQASLIYPAFLALTNPLINGHNTGFYRDEARLAVVVVSDAADTDPPNNPVAFYESFFVNLKGLKRRQEFSFSGIIPTLATEPPFSSGCSYDTSNAGTDTRVKQLAAATGGLVEEVCDADWSASLGRIGQRIFANRPSRYYLTNAPDMTVTPTPITVTIDGVAFPEFSSHSARQWSYDADINAIEFEPNAVPAPGSTVTVSYAVACL